MKFPRDSQPFSLFLQVEDLSPTGRLYPQRFVTAPNSSNTAEDDGGFLSFRLTKHQLPDPELSRRAEDAHLHLRLGPAYYVHTQDFLTTAIATLDRFLQYQDLMNRVRASSEGYKVRRELGLEPRLPMSCAQGQLYQATLLRSHLGIHQQAFDHQSLF